ncbi:hypothetical protein [Streptomyces sp. G45]|uniref:hypothetical protein n=1 Tax=Streptomyces sp. G45 TaxID=3406627 RepID=UPI003C1F4556
MQHTPDTPLRTNEPTPLPAKRLSVVTAPVVDSDLATVAEQAQAPSLSPARLCSGGGTCIALVEID